MNHCQNWVLLTLILSSLPSLLHLPLWFAGIASAGGIMHYSGKFRQGRYGRFLVFLLLVAAVCTIWFCFESWFSGDSVLGFFIVVVFLKWGESNTRRDYLLLIFASVILAAVGALYWENLLSLVHMMVVIFALTISLVAIHTNAFILKIRFLLRRAGILFLLGLPLMLLLFLTFPRIPGPIWDIGLAFGLPVKAMMDRESGEFGKSKTLQPGGIHRAAKENKNVLVAEFKGTVPFKSRLYWRGPVFWDYDGENWNLQDNWDDRNRLLKKAIRSKAKLDRELRWKSNPVRYTLRVMPNGGRWLYGLDVPAAPAPEAFISEEFQLLSIRKVDDHEPKFEMLSYLDYRTGSRLTKQQRKKGLAWPGETNPRLYALGRQLKDKYHNTQEILHQVFSLLAAGNYQFDAAYSIPSGKDQLDRFFFDEKKGGPEFLAGSFVMLMRAAGIPARLISGFRGGTIIALTNFVIVKQSDAHAWLEIWQDNKGWQRVDPKDIILPPAQKKNDSMQDKTLDNSTVLQIKQDKEKEPVQIKKKTGMNPEKKAILPVKKLAWNLPAWSSIFGNIQKWVIHYDPDRQIDILKSVGLKKSNWLDLLVSCLAGVGSILCLYLAGARWHGRTRADQVTKTWLQFCICLEKKFTLKKMKNECPGNYLTRVCLKKPEIAAATEDIIRRYIDIRYGQNDSMEAVTLFKRQVKRFISMV